jgi:hypothetical protein
MDTPLNNALNAADSALRTFAHFVCPAARQPALPNVAQ